MNLLYVAQRSLYDIRGKDGSGTSTNPVSPSSSNALSYTIRKLADGNCWMSENLYLPLAVGTSIEASYNNGSTFTYTPTSNASIGTNTRPGTGSYTSYYYYNWLAATGEKGTGFSTGDVDGSICPKGWKMPYNYTVSSTVSWGALTYAYLNITSNTSSTTGYLTLDTSPISLERAGYFWSGNFSGGNSQGRYWSSTATSSQYSYYLHYDSGRIDPQGSDNPANGFSVRCIASPLAH